MIQISRFRSIAFAMLVAAINGCYAARAQDAAQSVSTATVTIEHWQPQIEAVGNLRARWGTDLSFQTAGIVSEIMFHSGEDVQKGTVLARLQLNDESGLLGQYRAQAALDEINFNRDTKQFQVNAVSKAIVDRDRLTMEADRAHVRSEEGIIATKELRAPFAGRLGVRRIDPGQYLVPGTAVVTLQSLDPIYVDFYVPQNLSPHVANGNTVSIQVDAWPGRTFAGVVTAITPQVDTQSRTVLVRAQLANPDHALVPGAFARVTTSYEAVKATVVVPRVAVQYATSGNSIWLAVPDAKGNALHAHQQGIGIGQSRGDLVEVISGLKAGEKIVTSGQMKLYEGAPIHENNAIEPDSSATPAPPEE